MSNINKAFSRIYDQYVEKIYRFIFIKVNSQQIAEDLCSETFIRCLNTFKKNKNKIENVQAFLYQIARNLVIDYYREKGKVEIVPIEFVSIPDSNAGLEERALLDSDLGEIRQALTNLKENYQNIIICHYIDDLSIPEIALIMDKSEGSVRVTLHRALKALKNEIKQV
jgi:RNA polymerase sigma-70 factor (ECF subfamily)